MHLHSAWLLKYGDGMLSRVALVQVPRHLLVIMGLTIQIKITVDILTPMTMIRMTTISQSQFRTLRIHLTGLLGDHRARVTGCKI